MSQVVGGVRNPRPRVLIAANTSVGFGRGVLAGAIAYNRVRDAWDLTICPNWDINLDGLDSQVDGAILQVDADAAARLAREGPIAVNVDDGLDRFPLPSVINDNLAIGRMAAEHLLDRGFRRFGFHGEHGRYYSDQRLEGFRQTLAQRGGEVSVSPNVGGDVNAEGPFAGWLDSLPRATGVLTCHDAAAHAMVDAALRRGRRVPEDLAILGVDNDQMICETSRVPVSSVATSSQRIGFQAAALLHRLMLGQRDRSPQPRRMPPLGVVTRHSTEVLAVENPYVVAAIGFIREHLAERFGVEDIVARLPVSRRYLESRFQRALGRSPGAEIRRQRMDRACQLLQTTDLSVRDVGKACGYHEIALFSKAFRQSTGTTATAYRKLSRLGEVDETR